MRPALFLTVLLFALPASAAPCRGVLLRGDASAVRAVKKVLRSRGVLVRARPASCSKLQAHVQTDPAGFAVIIKDQHNRTSRRLVSRAAVAATLIESWMERGLTAHVFGLEVHPVRKTKKVRRVASRRRAAAAGRGWIGLDDPGPEDRAMKIARIEDQVVVEALPLTPPIMLTDASPEQALTPAIPVATQPKREAQPNVPEPIPVKTVSPAKIVRPAAKKVEAAAGVAEVTVPSPSASQPILLGVLLETGIADDATVWLGGMARAALPLGSLRGALLARFAATTTVQPDEALAGVQRLSVDLLPGIELPIALSSGLSLTPGLYLGAGWMRTGRSNIARAALESGAPILSDDASASTLRARAELRVGLDAALSETVTLEAGLSAGFLVLSHSEPFVPEYANQLDELDEMERERLGLAGEPAFIARLGVGIRSSLGEGR